MIFGARELQRRRIALVARCSAQRASIASAAEPLTAKAAAVDRILGAVRVHPLVATLAAGALAGLVPRVLPLWLTRLLLLYSVLRRFLG
ncbi:MAG TPA: hypothetical protein VGP97_04845 [Burkholderiales bacterium]|nr:hypothetical protein [Burkholderiales bacterium]